MDIPYILKQALISSIADIAAARGGYVGDLRTYTRNRKLTTFDIISLLIGFSGGSLNKELRLFNTDVTPSALSQRRKGISPRAFYEVWQSFNRRCDSLTRQRFHGKYHLWAVDETELPIFRNPNSSSFIITPTNPRGYNALHANVIHDINNSVFVDCAMGRDEQGQLLALIYRRKFTEPTILVMDRGYESYNTIAHCCNIPNFFFVLRVKQGKAALRDIQRLPLETLDEPFSVTVTTSQRNIGKESGWVYLNTGSRKGKTLSEKTRVTRFDFPAPHTINCRVVRFEIGSSGHYETLLTNLPCDEFPVEEMEKIYSLRWRIEQGFDALKNKTGLKFLHGRSDDCALQELYAKLTFFNFTSLICRAVAIGKSSGTQNEVKSLSRTQPTCAAIFTERPTQAAKSSCRMLPNTPTPTRKGEKRSAEQLNQRPLSRSPIEHRHSIIDRKRHGAGILKCQPRAIFFCKSPFCELKSGIFRKINVLPT